MRNVMSSVMRNLMMGMVSLMCVFVPVCCAPARQATKEGGLTESDFVHAPAQPQLGGKRAMPFAYIYKTNGDFNDNVTAVYDFSDNRFITYPAPTDVSVDSEPLQLADGWLLDRRGGIGMSTVFLKWTYAEYSDLRSVPTLEELRDAIIEDARVVDVVKLNMTTFAAQKDTAAVNRYIREVLM